MIFSVGTDIIEIERIKKAIHNDSFLSKVYTKNEILNFKASPNSLAGNFAVKEAIVKAFGTGFRGIMPNEIEVLRNEAGKPFVKLYGSALEFKEKNKLTNIHISISHNKADAIAFVVIETKPL